MSSEADEVTMVANPYRAALVAARQRATSPADGIATALDAAHRAMESGCWLSTTATTFGSDLGTHRTTLGNVQTNSMQRFDEAIGGQPEEVDSTVRPSEFQVGAWIDGNWVEFGPFINK